MQTLILIYKFKFAFSLLVSYFILSFIRFGNEASDFFHLILFIFRQNGFVFSGLELCFSRIWSLSWIYTRLSPL
jgi:hypothetical protein